MLESTYKLRHAKKQRRRWQAAATLTGQDLAAWMRDSLDTVADIDIENATTLPKE